VGGCLSFLLAGPRTRLAFVGESGSLASFHSWLDVQKTQAGPLISVANLIGPWKIIESVMTSKLVEVLKSRMKDGMV